MKDEALVLRPSWVEVDLDAVLDNLSQVRTLVAGKKLCAVVKADAYGLGAVPVCHVLAEAGVDAFGVVMLDEAVQLRRAGIVTPILNMGEILIEHAGYAVEYDVQQMIYRPESAQALSDAAARLRKKAIVHFKINTGMGRYGCDYEQALETLQQCRRYPHLTFEGVMTHFPLSDAVDKSFAQLQILRMKQLRRQFEQNGIDIPCWHMCNSGGVLDLPQAHMDMVRCGLLLYGYYPSEDVQRPLTLKPAMTVKTHIIAIRELRRGDSVGYSRRFIARGPERVAVLPIGYADGYDRKIRFSGLTLLNGRKAAIISGLCMDACFIRISEFPQARIGDPVILMGRSGKEEISPHDIAHAIQSVSYEVMARFGKRLPRLYFRNGNRVETIHDAMKG